MTERDIRRMIINDPLQVRNLLLSESLVKIVRMAMKKGSITTAELASIKGISAQNASMQLNRLYHKGYLGRLERIAGTGGIEYIYSPSIKPEVMSTETEGLIRHLKTKYGKNNVWNGSAELQRDFKVKSFRTPYVLVTRHSDGVAGMLVFVHKPRIYFNFTPDQKG